MALNVNIRKYLLKMHKLPFVEGYLSPNAMLLEVRDL